MVWQAEPGAVVGLTVVAGVGSTGTGTGAMKSTGAGVGSIAVTGAGVGSTGAGVGSTTLGVVSASTGAGVGGSTGAGVGSTGAGVGSTGARVGAGTGASVGLTTGGKNVGGFVGAAVNGILSTSIRFLQYSKSSAWLSFTCSKLLAKTGASEARKAVVNKNFIVVENQANNSSTKGSLFNKSCRFGRAVVVDINRVRRRWWQTMHVLSAVLRGISDKSGCSDSIGAICE